MTDLKLTPTSLKGNITVPPSKSMAHRAVICASLAKGRSRILNIQLSDDIRATIEGMRSFGATIIEERDALIIDGVHSKSLKTYHLIDCNESGSTLRFLLPIATLFEGESQFVGRGKLGSRPLKTYQTIFEEQGILYEPSQTNELDLKIEGSLQPGTYTMEGNVSSQFITGMLFALPLLKGDSTLSITTEMESKHYVDLTLSILETFGIQVDYDADYRQFRIAGNQAYVAKDYMIEGDYSQAAFFLGAQALGNDIRVKGLVKDSLQGDRAILSLLEHLNVDFLEEENGIAAQVDKLVANGVMDGAQYPDIIPVVALVSALSEGETQIINLARLRIKESDRLMATQGELEKLGASISIEGDSLHISGVSQLEGDTTVWSHRDHRMAMMLAIASTVCRQAIVIKDAECVAKSYPSFWQEFELLGGQINEWNMG